MKTISVNIKKTIADFFHDKPVKKVWLFGSYARGEENENSDIDVLIDIDNNNKIGLRYLIWHEEMEELLHKKVQIVNENSVSKYIRPFIDADKILIYER